MPTAVHQTPAPILSYDGRIADLYRIFLVNLLLNIVTLGIWRFWGTTRTRRYIWSRTSSLGSRFEYDGTGGQLFVGFLLAMLIVIVMLATAIGGMLALRKAGPFVSLIPLFVFEMAIFVLALGAPFSAQRYRLGHTVWRGIRGGMQGSMVAYGLRSFGYLLLVILSFYQCWPWASIRLMERRVNASSFGNQRFAVHGRARALYARYLIAFLGVVALSAVVFGITFVFAKPLFAAIYHAQQLHLRPDPHITNRLTLTFLPAYFIVAVGASVISAGYTAAYIRHMAGNTTLGGLQFSSAVTAQTVVRLVVGNILLLLFTLGFGIPVVTHRNVRYFTSNLLTTGSLDLEHLSQNPQPVSRFGEGMFQALDAGVGIG